VDTFEAQRPRLLGLAYRLVGGRADAEDVVQEAWLRWSGVDESSIANPGGWLTTVTTRIALDRMRQVQRRREDYVGPWLPEPVSTERTPEERAELAESLTLGFLVMLDRLSPLERAVFLLADIFAEPYSVIAEAVGKSEVACRQIASRSRRKIRSASAEPGGVRPDSQPAPAELLQELMVALINGDEAEAVRLLDPDVVLVSDAGPSRHAARRPVVGAYRVHRLLTGGWRLLGFHARPTPESFPPARVEVVNAGPAIVVDSPEGPIVVSGQAHEGRITQIWIRLNPEKTGALAGGPVGLV
jgi:RNA polymerase sigma-70 factor (ECF subfamily)